MVADKKLTRADLSDDQREVYEQIVDWTTDPIGKFFDAFAPVLTVGGLAGTGKTTLLGVFAAETKKRVAYAAFTGRAASVLSRKLCAAGVEHPIVTTLHQLLYMPVVDPKTEEILGWKKRVKLPEVDLIVIDEASMVSGRMLDDIRALGRPILAVGDHGQLPPVMDSGDLMKNPDLRLERIHRQAEGSPIIRFAHAIRETGRLDRRFVDGDVIQMKRRDACEDIVRMAYVAAHDDNESPLTIGLLCYTNEKRIHLNAYARKALGFKGVPNAGEVVICLRNVAPHFNGMRGVLTTSGVLDGWKVKASIEFPEEGLPSLPIEMYAGQFNQRETLKSIEQARARGIHVDKMAELGELFDFGFSLTVHKSQGSAFQHVVGFIDREVSPSSEEWRRWAYTLVTRASERLTILV